MSDVPSASPVVSVEGLWKRYGRHPAVADVSFQVHDREVLGLLGPNGSGKTTILRIVTGYLRPSAGTIRIGGIETVENGLETRKLIGYVQENAPLYGHMRVREFLGFMGRLRGLPEARLQQRIEEACERLALHAVGDTVIGRLSHGYRKRVSIAQAILHAPRLLVLDEPTNGLDPRQIIELRGLLAALARDCAVLVTSHILAEMARIADRVAILLDGRLLTVHRLPRHGHGPSLRLHAPAASGDAVAASLAAMPGIARLTAEPSGEDSRVWRLETADAGAAAALAARLSAAGIAIVEPLAAETELEDLFLRLTASKALH